MANEQQPGGRRLKKLGRYEIVSHIATGGMGAVYKATDSRLGRSVALKVLPPEVAVKPNMVERFHREAKAAARLQHENIVALIDDGEENGTHFIVLEFVEGVDLHKYITRKGKLDPEEARKLVLQAARALEHAHQQGIVHRDIKPGNFLLTKKNGKLLLKLTDLGLARRVNEEEFRVTRDGTTVGTIDYISPEQATNSGSADIRSDIYSLGCTLFHMLGGIAPFPHGSLPERLMHHLKTEPPDIRDLNPDVPGPLALILARMLAKSPDDRYQDPSELIADLENPDQVRSSTDRLASLADLASAESLGLVGNDDEPAAPASEDTESQYRLEGEEAIRPRRPRAKKKKAKKDTEKPEPAKPRRATWWPWAVGGIGLGLVLFTVVAMNSRTRPTPVLEEPKPDKKPPVVIAEKKVEPVEKPPPEKDRTPPGPVEPAWPTLFKPVRPLPTAEMHKEYLGGLDEGPLQMVKATKLQVRRGTPDVPESLAEAWKRIDEDDTINIVEISDNGPLFVSSLPPLVGRHIVVRPAPGYRPLLVWDVISPAKPGPLFTVMGGSLTLRDLDIVTKWPESGEDEVACIAVRNGDALFQDCTFSVAGRPRRSVPFLQLEGNGLGMPADDGVIRIARFDRCYLRGTNVAAMHMKLLRAEVMLRDTLVVGSDEPLVRLAGGLGDSLTVRFVRSTLVARQNLIRCQHAGNRDGGPRLQVRAWDSILACADSRPVDGNLLHLEENLQPLHVNWKASNCLHAGWKNLMHSPTKTIGGMALDQWRSQWAMQDGEKLLDDPWPPRLGGDLADTPAALFATYNTPACYTAHSRPGVIGAMPTRLPLAPEGWLERTFDRLLPVVLPLPDVDSPSIPTGSPDLYHGEQLALNHVDLGQYLTKKLASMKPGPRVVVHLTGSGPQTTSPIYLRNVTQLVLHAETPQGKDPPLILVPRGPAPFLQVDGGSVELSGLRILCDNATTGSPSHVVSVRGGDLSLYRCVLQGPMTLAGQDVRSLVHIAGSGEGATEPRGLALKECILLSGKRLLETTGPGVRVRARNCVFVSLDDVLHCDLGPLPFARPQVSCLLENNTFALRRQLFTAKVPTGIARAPILVQAAHNVFLDPFAEEPRQGCVLRLPEDALPSGYVLWQGKQNIFDKRLQGFIALGQKPAQSWTKLLGPFAELSSLQADLPRNPKTALSQDAPQLERLALPASVVVGTPVPGADLGRLGVLKKKT